MLWCVELRGLYLFSLMWRVEEYEEMSPELNLVYQERDHYPTFFIH